MYEYFLSDLDSVAVKQCPVKYRKIVLKSLCPWIELFYKDFFSLIPNNSQMINSSDIGPQTHSTANDIVI